MTTATDYSALESRELDALVAERVMGLVPCQNERAHDPASEFYIGNGNCHAQPDSPTDGGEDPFYSTTWEGAGLVLEAMRERGWRWAVYPAASGPAIAATFSRTGKGNRHLEGQAVTAPAPRAVCIAALRAIAAGGE